MNLCLNLSLRRKERGRGGVIFTVLIIMRRDGTRAKVDANPPQKNSRLASRISTLPRRLALHDPKTPKVKAGDMYS